MKGVLHIAAVVQAVIAAVIAFTQNDWVTALGLLGTATATGQAGHAVGTSPVVPPPHG